MQSKRGELVPIAKVLSDLGGPVAAIREASPNPPGAHPRRDRWPGSVVLFRFGSWLAMSTHVNGCCVPFPKGKDLEKLVARAQVSLIKRVTGGRTVVDC